VASPAAYQEPTLQTSWQDFVRHLPVVVAVGLVTMLLSLLGLALMAGIWMIMMGGINQVLAAPDPASAPALSIRNFALFVGSLAQLPFAILAGYVGVLFTAVPALHYASGRVISVQEAFGELARRPRRYFVAGVLFAALSTAASFACFLPGLLVNLVTPVYVNRIFTTDQPVLEVLQQSFQTCYGTEKGRSFLLAQGVAWLVFFALTFCTCFLGGLVATPMLCFYLQNLAYCRGVVR
jgi:hypothetical protein